MPVSDIVDGIIDLFQKNLIAKTNAISDITVGSNTISVENTFHFDPDQEIVVIDWGYTNQSHPHFNIYEYARIKTINNTTSMTLYDDVTGSWLCSDRAFIQKTIGHAPLYEERILYGDRQVIPTEEMAITIEPNSLNNEWIYIQGGLSEEYSLTIRIYGKDPETEVGMKILSKYADAVYELLNSNIHLDINNYYTPLQFNVVSGSNTVLIEDTPENRERILPSANLVDWQSYGVQDNNNVEKYLIVNSVTIGGGNITVEFQRNLVNSYSLSDFGVLIRYGRYVYDSRVDKITYGVIQKSSGILRVAELNWFGKEVNEYVFCQPSKAVDRFEQLYESSSSSSSSSISSSSSSSSS